MNRRRFLGGSISAPLLAATSMAWDVDGQRRRRREINALHRRACAGYFRDDGSWSGPATEGTGRVRFWHAMSLIEDASSRELGNAVIRRCFQERAKLPASFSLFEYCSAAQLAAKQPQQLDADNREALHELLAEALAQQKPIEFRGYNDNYPAMVNVAATLGGEALDDSNARERGIAGMRRLIELFERRGLLSEYTSSTYTPITLLCYADIAEFSQDAEARQLALRIERRIWLDLAVHFHASTNILAGPHSRAYTVDSVGHLYDVHMLLYQAFGERVWLNPARFLYPPVPKQVIHHEGDLPFMQACSVWFASGMFHPSPEIARLTFDQKLPSRVAATSEFGAAVMPILERRANGKFEARDEVFEYPAGAMVSTTFLTSDYAVGSASCQFHDGNQTDAFFVNFRRAAKPSTLADTGTIYCRYAVNGNGPGVPWLDPRNEADASTTDLLADTGRVRTVQKDGTVLALYQSKGQFLDDYGRLRLVITVPVFYRSLKRVAVGEGSAVDSARPEIVWIEDEFLYAAFRPLVLTDHGRRVAVSVEERHGYLAISFFNYDGAPRRFTRKELLRTLNGFVAEIGSPSEFGSFERFRSRVLEGAVEDVVADDQRMTRYSRPGVRLDLSHSLYSGGLKYALVDGKPQRRPIFEGPGISL